MNKNSDEEVVTQVLSETFNARDGHRGMLTRTIVLAGHVIEAGSLVHFTQEAGSIQASQGSIKKKYHPFDAVIHFGNQDPGRPRSTIRLRGSGARVRVVAVRSHNYEVNSSPYRMGLTQRA